MYMYNSSIVPKFQLIRGLAYVLNKRAVEHRSYWTSHPWASYQIENCFCSSRAYEQVKYLWKRDVLFSTFLFNTSESGYLTASEYFVLLKTSPRVVQELFLIMRQLLFLAVEYLAAKLFTTSVRPGCLKINSYPNPYAIQTCTYL